MQPGFSGKKAIALQKALQEQVIRVKACPKTFPLPVHRLPQDKLSEVGQDLGMTLEK